ncbi:TauD/TfdA family dioxygenase [Mycoavidus sp. SF9855]|uniref:TauD/TfdA family dioxygenase n=1 Tax=Mycoavidus sp. SF9855 TaxID=2968475 RepID=UPI00211CD399|nr:TauD/TfdA family dioxygenase [Mycoavidus sp. SF9855]UUM20785.1 TauD/TfdA family dioxygenase [Mycoavidus sp. SF9855]
MENKYSGISVRTLKPSERAAHTDENHTPLVIEPLRTRSLDFLHGFMKENSAEIISALEKHGAILFRGFDVRSSSDFEEQVLAIQGMSGMSEMMMSEPGRTLVNGTRHVIHPSTNFKTGGTLDPVGGIHTESYYVPDVPRFISFFCQKPPLLGGETGLFNTCQIYSHLPEDLKLRLERQPYLAGMFSISQIGKRYNLSYDEAKSFCTKMGMSITDYRGDGYAFMYKPSVTEHPTTHEKALAIHFGGELNGHGLSPELIKAFAPDYSSFKWCLHRAVWSMPYLRRNLFMLRHPIVYFRDGPSLMGRIFESPNKIIPNSETDGLRVGHAFTKEDIKLLANLTRRYYSSFLWQKGDFIIIDNLKLAHAGMPGLGSRIIKVLMCNPLSMTYRKESSGLCKPKNDQATESWGAKILKPSAAAIS